MVIDTHVHLIRPFDSKGDSQTYSPGNATSAEDFVALMDASEIDRAFFISWSPEDIPSDLIRKKIPVESVRETMSRDYALEVMAGHGERFYWFPCHLGPALGDGAAMARRNLELGAAGVKMVVSFWGELPDAERLIPIYDVVREHGAAAIIDTSFWALGKDEPADADTLEVGHRDVARRVTDFQDYVRHLDAVIGAYPDVNFQLAHAGARIFTVEHAAETGRYIATRRNVWADLGALPLDSPALEALVETAGADRVMFGTDWPHFAQGERMRELLDEVRRPGRFAPGVAERILGENAIEFAGGRTPGLASGRSPERVRRVGAV